MEKGIALKEYNVNVKNSAFHIRVRIIICCIIAGRKTIIYIVRFQCSAITKYIVSFMTLKN